MFAGINHHIKVLVRWKVLSGIWKNVAQPLVQGRRQRPGRRPGRCGNPASVTPWPTARKPTSSEGVLPGPEADDGNTLSAARTAGPVGALLRLPLPVPLHVVAGNDAVAKLMPCVSESAFNQDDSEVSKEKTQEINRENNSWETQPSSPCFT